MIIGSNPISKPSGRGSFILFEGVDRCGKTTQCGLLVKHLISLSIAAVAMRFPDRTTPIGELINSYLCCGKQVDDRSVHLLFSANRWEAASSLAQTIADGKTVVCDRYAYSGVAFTSAKENADLSIDWCKAPDMGLPAPDAVIFLDLSQEEAEERGGFGEERYEKRDFQIKVRQQFSKLQSIDEKEGTVPWYIVDASQTIEEVQKEINQIVENTMEKVSSGAPVARMFGDGNYKLPDPSTSSKSP